MRCADYSGSNDGTIVPRAMYFKVLGRHVLRMAQIMTPPDWELIVMDLSLEMSIIGPR